MFWGDSRSSPFPKPGFGRGFAATTVPFYKIKRGDVVPMAIYGVPVNIYLRTLAHGLLLEIYEACCAQFF